MIHDVPERVVRSDGAPALSRGDGVVSLLLHGDGTATDPGDTALTVTRVTVEPGAAQRPHDHAPEQVYVIVAGSGRMRVGETERSVAAGDLAHVPPDTTHGIENTGDEPLTYVSAATPAFDRSAVEAFYDA